MGRRPGHLFHPAEAKGGGILFGHGPVFRDFNFDMDRAAATTVAAMRPPITFVPYDAARNLSLTGPDLAAMEAAGGAAAWIAVRARGWLDYWARDVGRDGFFPFDLLAAAYVIERGSSTALKQAPGSAGTTGCGTSGSTIPLPCSSDGGTIRPPISRRARRSSTALGSPPSCTVG